MTPPTPGPERLKSIKDECLDRMILFGEEHLERVNGARAQSPWAGCSSSTTAQPEAVGAAAIPEAVGQLRHLSMPARAAAGESHLQSSQALGRAGVGRRPGLRTTRAAPCSLLTSPPPATARETARASARGGDPRGSELERGIGTTATRGRRALAPGRETFPRNRCEALHLTGNAPCIPRLSMYKLEPGKRSPRTTTAPP